MNNNGSDFFTKNNEQPNLTSEEIWLVKERRKRLNLPGPVNNNGQPVLNNEEIMLVYKRRRRLSGSESSPENFKVNIPARELYSSDNIPDFRSGSQNTYNNPYRAVNNGYNNAPRQRYDHNAYLASQNENIPDIPLEKPKKKKKKSGCSSKITSLFLVLVLIIVGCYGYVVLMAGKVQSAELNDNYTSGLVRNSDIKNILLIGLDKEDGGISRSDTMMLLSIDTDNKTLKLTSFLRDMWVSIPGQYSSKLNASYALGGPQLTVDTIESNFKIDIDHFVLVDFEMFEKIIDSLGGVTVDITEYEAQFLRNNTRVKVDAGENTLNGEWALIYSRIRKLDSDFNRTQRQRKVISAIIDEAKHTNPIKLAGMLSDIMPLITTDIGQFELTQLAFSALKYISYDIDQLQVPANDAYTSQTISGQAALVPDMEKNTNNIHKFIYGTGD